MKQCCMPGSATLLLFGVLALFNDWLESCLLANGVLDCGINVDCCGGGGGISLNRSLPGVGWPGAQICCITY